MFIIRLDWYFWTHNFLGKKNENADFMSSSVLRRWSSFWKMFFITVWIQQYKSQLQLLHEPWWFFIWDSDNIKASNFTKLYEDRYTSIKQICNTFLSIAERTLLVKHCFDFFFGFILTFKRFWRLILYTCKIIFDSVYLKTIYYPQLTKKYDGDKSNNVMLTYHFSFNLPF